MERRVDQHEDRRRCRPSPTHSKIASWREAWTACYNVVSEWDSIDLKRFHFIFERWVSILNRVFDNPVRIEKYDFTLFYCDSPNGPKEIIHIYMNENQTPDGKTPTYVIFNLHEFRKVHAMYCTNYSKNNQMLVDESRGTVNMSSESGPCSRPAHYFKNLTTCQLLFIYTLHALAHLEVFDIYDHAHYDTHMYMRESVFFKIYFYGQIIWQR